MFQIFFGNMRKYGGNNSKPDCIQFQSALRKVLADKNIFFSERGNCTNIDPPSEYYPLSNVGTITSRRKKAVVENTYTPDDVEEVLKELHEINARSTKRSNLNLTDLNDISTAYVASTIEINILKSEDHQWCASIFSENEKVHQAFTGRIEHIRVNKEFYFFVNEMDSQ